MRQRIQRTDRVKLFIRLATDVNNSLRTLLRYRGDLSHLIEEALTKIDLTKVNLFGGIARGNGLGTTATVKVRTELRLKSAAKARGCSVNALANSAISAWLTIHGHRT